MHDQLVEKEIRNLVRDAIGFDESVTSIDSIRIATSQRMNAIGEKNVDHYLAYLQGSASERDELLQLLLVSESYFEREPATLDALTQYLRSLKETQRQKKIRMLSAPCARGEEVISLLHAAREAGFDICDIEIVGIDYSVEAIRLAMEGVYTQHSFRETPRSFIESYFLMNGNHYVLRKEFRLPLTFKRENLFELSFDNGSFDVVFCRNLLIYLGRAEQEKLLGKLTETLKVDGLLALGIAEVPYLSEDYPFRKSIDTHAVFFKRGRGSPQEVGKERRKESSRPYFVPEKVKEVARIEKKIGEESENVIGLQSSVKPELEQLLGDAFTAANNGDFISARENCFLIIEDNPLVPDCYYLLGLLSRAQGDEEMSVAYFRRTLYLDPKHEEAITQLSITKVNKSRHV